MTATIHLVQILLPLRDNEGEPFPRATFDAVRAELTERFGGLTAYNRAPAEGVFSDDEGRVMRDDVMVIEVMCEGLDRAFWHDYRERLTEELGQEELVVRALAMERL